MGTWPRGSVWLGTSIQNDDYVGRADALRAAPAAVRFLSLAPLPGLDLAGSTGSSSVARAIRGHRPLDLDWVREIREAASSAMSRCPSSNRQVIDAMRQRLAASEEVAPHVPGAAPDLAGAPGRGHRGPHRRARARERHG